MHVWFCLVLTRNFIVDCSTIFYSAVIRCFSKEKVLANVVDKVSCNNNIISNNIPNNLPSRIINNFALKSDFFEKKVCGNNQNKSEQIVPVLTKFICNKITSKLAPNNLLRKVVSNSKVKTAANFASNNFIDLCIMLNCDYTESIKGIGPKRAIDLITQHKSIEDILKNLDTKKYAPPENWNYDGVRDLFKDPEITDPSTIDLKWTDPDEEGLVKYLCGDEQFNEERVHNGTEKLMKAKGVSTQGRLDG